MGNEAEIEEGVRITKEVMSKNEDKNNDNKEEILNFGGEESGKIRMLGSWMGWKADVDESRYYQLISSLYSLNIFTMLFINFIKNGSGHYFFIIFCQNRDLDMIC